MVLLREFIKLHANMDMTTKKWNFRNEKDWLKDCECSLEYKNVKDDLIL